MHEGTMKASLKYILRRWEKYAAEKGRDDYLTAYIHLPFCSSRCAYCTFESHVPKGPPEIDRYIKALDREMALFSPALKGVKLSGFYVGGGTPSLLSIGQIEKLLDIIGRNFDLDLREGNMFTYETHPAHLDEEKIDFLAGSIINRVSVGIQTFNRSVLKRERRKNPSNERISFLLGYLLSSFKGKKSQISVDLMVGLKGQTVKTTIKDFALLSEIDVPRIVIFPNRQRRKSEAERRFRKYVVRSIDAIGAARHNFRLITPNDTFRQEYIFIDDRYDHQFKRTYANIPRVHNSNIAFGVQADSFIHPGAFYYSREGRGYCIENDREKGIIHPQIDAVFVSAERNRESGRDLSRIPY